MDLRVFADLTWVLTRALLQLTALSIAVGAWSFIVESFYYGSLFFLTIVVVYFTLAYAQLKTPLFRLSEEWLQIVNFFHLGQVKIALTDLQSVTIASGKLMFTTTSKTVSLSLLGMREDHKQKSLRDIQSALKEAGVKIS